jgi:hypothetical protein
MVGYGSKIKRNGAMAQILFRKIKIAFPLRHRAIAFNH